jgi:hypothetical protein
MEKLNVKSQDDLDYKVNFISQKSEPKPEIWDIIYNHVHSFATKDIKEEADGEVLNVGDAKITLGEKFQKMKEEKRKKEVFFKPRKAFYTFLLLVLIAAVVWYFFFLKPLQWEVVNLSGAPTVKGNLKNIVVAKSSVLENDDVLYTDMNSKALVKIPETVEIYLNPGSSFKRDGGDGEISVWTGTVNFVKKEGSVPFPVEVFSAIIEDYKAGSYSIKVENNKATVYSMGAGLLITSGESKVYLIPQYMCEVNQKGNVSIPYSISATEEYISAVNDFSVNKNEEGLNIILLQSEKKDALTLFNILQMTNKESREIVINKLHSLISIPKDINPRQVSNLNDEDLMKWLKAIEEQN